MMALLRTAGAIVTMGTVIAATALPTTSFTQDNRGAYDVALRCFVANVRAEGIERRAGRASSAERYRLFGRESFEAMSALGIALGKSRAQMDADIRASQANDLPRMVSDTDYFRSVVSTCRAYGLMPPA